LDKKTESSLEPKIAQEHTGNPRMPFGEARGQNVNRTAMNNKCHDFVSHPENDNLMDQ